MNADDTDWEGGERYVAGSPWCRLEEAKARPAIWRAVGWSGGPWLIHGQ